MSSLTFRVRPRTRVVIGVAALVALAAACQPPASTPTVAFTPFRAYATATGPRRVLSADVNHDGRADLLTLSSTGNALGVMLADGAGGLAPRTDYSAGPMPTVFAVGDLNGDDYPDVVIGDSNPVGLVVLMNTGTGLFGPATSISTPGLSSAAGGVALAKLDAGNTLDLVYTDQNGAKAYVAPGAGNGTFGTPVGYTTGTLPQAVAVGDVNGDAKPDLVVADQTAALGMIGTPGFVSVLPGNGTGSFGAKTDYPVGDNPQFVATADLNGDHKDDIVVGDAGDDYVGTLISTGPSFAPATETFAGSFIKGLAVGDLNGDAKPDVVVSEAQNEATTLIGNGDGTWQPLVRWRLTLGSNANQLSNLGAVVADLTGDGKADVAVAESNVNQVAVVPGLGDGALRAYSLYGLYLKPAAVADFNGDGAPDLIGADGLGSAPGPGIGVALGNKGPNGHANGTLQPDPVRTAVANLAAIAVNPLNGGALQGDSHADAVVAQSNGTLAVLRGVGDGTFQAAVPYAIATGATSAAVGDVNGDSMPDIVTASPAFGSVSVLFGLANGTFAPHADSAVGLAPATVAIGDVTGDGRNDIVVANANSSANSVSVLPGTGTNTFGALITVPLGQQPVALALGHFHSSGPLDIATANAASSGVRTVSIVHSMGSGTFSAATNITVADYSQGLAIADLDGNGNQDIFVGGGTPSSQILNGNGDGTFQAPVTGPDWFTGNAPIAADMNVDGHPDLIVNGGTTSLSIDLATPVSP